jgi:uncharacterized Zn-binding protein involved in type VI secretion
MAQEKPPAPDPKAQAAASAKAKKSFDAAVASAQSSLSAAPGAGFPAARASDLHICPMLTVLVPHVGGPILPPCEITVLTGGLPQARVTDMLTCVGPPDTIVLGSFTVLVGGLPAARMMDMTAHGGLIVLGEFTVLIGG